MRLGFTPLLALSERAHALTGRVDLSWSAPGHASAFFSGCNPHTTLREFGRGPRPPVKDSYGAYPKCLGHTRCSRLESRLERAGKGFFGFPIPGEKNLANVNRSGQLRLRAQRKTRPRRSETSDTVAPSGVYSKRKVFINTVIVGKICYHLEHIRGSVIL